MYIIQNLWTCDEDDDHLRLLDIDMYTPYWTLVENMGTSSAFSAKDLSKTFRALINVFVTPTPT